MGGYVKVERRISIITDILIFILLSVSAFLILNIFKELIRASTLQADNFVEISEPQDEIDEENLEYVKKIRDEFGVNIRYGASQKEIAATLNAEAQENNGIINNNIKLIYNALGKYNPEMFKKFAKEGYQINIIIFDKFNDDNLALASKNKLNQFNIYISNAVKLERAFHHEMCHILEYYVSDKGIDFEYWNNLNSSDFEYENTVANLNNENVYYLSSYSKENIDKTYFVTKYSKVDEKEDRAEIFAEIMTTNTPLAYIEDKTPIYLKYKYLMNTFKVNIEYASFNNYYNIDFEE